MQPLYQSLIERQKEILNNLGIMSEHPLREIWLRMKDVGREIVYFIWERRIDDRGELVISSVPVAKARFYPVTRLDDLSTVSFDVAPPPELIMGNWAIGYQLTDFSSPNEVMGHPGFRAARFALSEPDLRKLRLFED